MNVRSEIYDVFLSFPADCTMAAVQVEARLVALGLTVFTRLKLPPGRNWPERLREELGASLSVVVILGERPRLPASVAVEVGAALAWKKPVYAVLDNPAELEPGTLPADIQIIRPRELERVARDVRSTSAVTAQQRELLAKVYTEINVPTDQLTLSPGTLDRFADRFNKATHTRWSQERLLREIFVLRKRGRLPRLRKNPRTSELSPA